MSVSSTSLGKANVLVACLRREREPLHAYSRYKFSVDRDAVSLKPFRVCDLRYVWPGERPFQRQMRQIKRGTTEEVKDVPVSPKAIVNHAKSSCSVLVIVREATREEEFHDG